MLQDLRYGLRMLARSPGFTAVAILSLALGIGGNTAIFSLLKAALFEPLPYRDPEQLVKVDLAAPQDKAKKSPFPWSYPKFELLARSARSFEQACALAYAAFSLTDTDSPERLRTEMVSTNYFALLGIGASQGRVFTPGDDSPVVVISHALWQRRFGAEPGLIGRTIHLNRHPLTVIGVAPQGFRGQLEEVDLFLPIHMAPVLQEIPHRLTARDVHWHHVLARLQPGVTVAAAQSEMSAFEATLFQAFPRSRYGVKATSLKDALIDPRLSGYIALVFGATGLVLLIGCVNVANLLMGRAVARQREIAVRAAVGGSRGRLVCQLLTESAVLGLAAGVAGLLIMVWSVDLLARFRPGDLPGLWGRYPSLLQMGLVRVDWLALVFHFALALATAFLFGLLPALHASRLDLRETLQGAAGHSGRFRTRGLLIAAEVALAVPLVAGAGLLVRSLGRMLETPLGFNPARLLTAYVELPRARYKPDQQVRFFNELAARLAALPGVESVSTGDVPGFGGHSSFTIYKIAGRSEDQDRLVGVHEVRPGYFRTLRIPLVAGRAFTERDNAGAPPVAILNATAARNLFPGESPLGHKIRLPLGRDDWVEIVGVVGDVRYRGYAQPVSADVYLPSLQWPSGFASVILRARRDPSPLAAAVRGAVLALDRNVPVYNVQTMEQHVLNATSQTRYSAALLGLFAALAGLLAAIGIYGVTAYAVTARVREIGIRLALGAPPREIWRLALHHGAIFVACGLAVGLAISFAGARVMTGFLYGVGAHDLVTFVAVPFLLGAVALAACLGPARRATHIDPLEALRYE